MSKTGEVEVGVWDEGRAREAAWARGQGGGAEVLCTWSQIWVCMPVLLPASPLILGRF